MLSNSFVARGHSWEQHIGRRMHTHLSRTMATIHTCMIYQYVMISAWKLLYMCCVQCQREVTTSSCSWTTGLLISFRHKVFLAVATSKRPLSSVTEQMVHQSGSWLEWSFTHGALEDAGVTVASHVISQKFYNLRSLDDMQVAKLTAFTHHHSILWNQPCSHDEQIAVDQQPKLVMHFLHQIFAQ